MEGKKKETRYNWREVPKWVNWLAMNYDGKIMGFENEPWCECPQGQCTWCSWDKSELILDTKNKCSDSPYTLEKRPEQ